jgi:hypothetical protein
VSVVIDTELEKRHDSSGQRNVRAKRVGLLVFQKGGEHLPD